MTRATLAEVLQPALRDGYALAGLVCLGWEDARAYVAAAEAEGAPVILQAGPGARAHMPLPVWAAMFHALADGASVPVVSHLDHGNSAKECAEAIALGFTSVMFDGSRLPLEENIAQTKAIVEMARQAGVSCEGEIGFVGYAEGATSEGTDPDEAARFAEETGVDAMAVSIGNVHLQTDQSAEIDRVRLARIEESTNVPLVIHGGSGLSHSLRSDLARTSTICKFNIGTELRMTFGAALRQTLQDHPDRFDRISLLKELEEPLALQARRIIQGLGQSS
ncbi:class II fructose-bisphosphate aldolase [Marivita sp. XM-24bin2]|jgi:fructose-bisphosphate aldolase class II|uniref:class II fructose-bisphosphate aldolase n=1 Tax=unclassified Marivita TaxID=2632480 RepID=UPI000D7943C6|nr:class II fructose-bisphosphate aldolase [Marivita sp. XM-24bin2]MCR9108952.1 class II fructose-bisphosphate aldolase [Paracoccaceae bacterium]PWL36741.1 MAG: fructose-bisphosphate aldolase [Marivita sp. XM-24bin2]